VLILSLFTVAFPWYFIAWKDPSGSGCEVLKLTSWMDEYCVSKNCPDVISDACTKINWQDQCSGIDGCDDRKRVFDISLGLTAVSTFCALFVSVGFCIRCCSSAHKRRNPLHIVTSLMSLILLAGALTYFAIKIPSNNFWCDGESYTCNRFWGHDSNTGVTWGPAGWVAGCFTAIIVLLSLCMSCQRSGDEIELGTYYSVGEHGEGSYGRTSNTHNFTHTAASTNYAGTSYVGTNNASY
jgi:hypothetical protein